MIFQFSLSYFLASASPSFASYDCRYVLYLVIALALGQLLLCMTSMLGIGEVDCTL